MEIVVAVAITLFVVAAFAALLRYIAYGPSKKARYYAVTLVNNEGTFVGLCIKKRRGYWTFVDVKVQPTNPGGAVVKAADGHLYVPYPHILYYQEMANVAE